MHILALDGRRFAQKSPANPATRSKTKDAPPESLSNAAEAEVVTGLHAAAGQTFCRRGLERQRRQDREGEAAAGYDNTTISRAA